MFVTSLIRSAAIILAATIAGAVWAQYQGFAWTVDNAKVEKRQEVEESALELIAKGDEKGSEHNIDLSRFQELIAQQAVIIDARNANQYEKQHLYVYHDPPVLNVPPDDFDLHIERLMQLQGNPMVLYCNSETCHLAEELLIRLKEQGFLDMAPIYIYKPGWDAIVKTDMPKTSGPDNWSGYGSVPVGEGP